MLDLIVALALYILEIVIFRATFLEEEDEGARRRRIVVTLHLQIVHVQALELPVVEREVADAVFVRLEKFTVRINIFIINVQLSLGAFSHGQGFEIDALHVFFDAPAFVVRLEHAIRWVFNRLVVAVIRSDPKRVRKIFTVCLIRFKVRVPLAHHHIRFVIHEQLDRLH